MDFIEANDAVEILAQENIVERLNVLFKYELIYYKNGKIFISEKGKKFRKNNDKVLFPAPPIHDSSFLEEE